MTHLAEHLDDLSQFNNVGHDGGSWLIHNRRMKIMGARRKGAATRKAVRDRVAELGGTAEAVRIVAEERGTTVHTVRVQMRAPK